MTIINVHVYYVRTLFEVRTLGFRVTHNLCSDEFMAVMISLQVSPGLLIKNRPSTYCEIPMEDEDRMKDEDEVS